LLIICSVGLKNIVVLIGWSFFTYEYSIFIFVIIIFSVNIIVMIISIIFTEKIIKAKMKGI